MTTETMSTMVDVHDRAHIVMTVEVLMATCRRVAGDHRQDNIEGEAASIAVQAIMLDSKDPGAVIQGMVTQLGFQIGYRAVSDPGSWADQAKAWIDEGVAAATKAGGIGAPAQGRA